MLSGVLRKSIFWRTHSQVSMSEREKNVLNAYLDGYDAKLTIKNYAKLCKISTDTAARDIHDLEDKGVLHMAQGRVRDASYSLVYSHDVLQYENLTATEHDGKHYISATLSDHSIIEERISDIDWLRYSQKEISLQDLADKYLAFLKIG